MINQKNAYMLAIMTIITHTTHAHFFEDMDNHFKQLWNALDNDISFESTESSVKLATNYNQDTNAVTIKITMPGLTNKDVAFNMVEDNKMVLEAKTDTHESLIVITNKSILIEQKEYEELTNKNGKTYTLITGHNRTVNTLPKTVILHEAVAEYENGVLTLTIPSATKKVSIPVNHKVTSQPVATVEAEKPAPKKIVVTSKKQENIVAPDTK